jgi:hypothetical protein
LDTSGNPLSGYPEVNYTKSTTPLEEQKGINLAADGIPIQIFTVPPATGETTAQVSFVTPVLDADKKVQAVLVGHTDLASNLFTPPILASLKNLAGEDGQGILVDDNGRILVATDPAQVMTTYSGRTGSEPLFYIDTAPNGTRRLVYYHPAVGRPWAVVLMVANHRAQEIALRIASPLLGMILILSIIGVVFLSVGLRAVTGSLQNLATEAGRISKANSILLFQSTERMKLASCGGPLNKCAPA